MPATILSPCLFIQYSRGGRCRGFYCAPTLKFRPSCEIYTIGAGYYVTANCHKSLRLGCAGAIVMYG